MRSAAFLGVMGPTFGRRIFARTSDRASPPCKGGVLIGAPTTVMEEASRARMSLVPARQCSLESVREGPTTEAFPEPQALRGSRLVLGSAPVGATDLFATAENVSLAQDLALLPRYAWQTSLQSVREEARLTTGPQPLMEERQTLSHSTWARPLSAPSRLPRRTRTAPPKTSRSRTTLRSCVTSVQPATCVRRTRSGGDRRSSASFTGTAFAAV